MQTGCVNGHMTSTRFMVYRLGYSQNLPHMIQKKDTLMKRLHINVC